MLPLCVQPKMREILPAPLTAIHHAASASVLIDSSARGTDQNLRAGRSAQATGLTINEQDNTDVSFDRHLTVVIRLLCRACLSSSCL